MKVQLGNNFSLADRKMAKFSYINNCQSRKKSFGYMYYIKGKSTMTWKMANV